MFAKIAASALFGLTVSAAPWGAAENWPSEETWGRGSNIDTRANGQTAFKFPLSNGFPNVKPGSAQLTAIEKQAHGTLPNGALPKHIEDDSATAWQLIAFNEIFEVAYFTSLIQNVTNSVPGYEIKSGAVRNIVLNALTTIQGQEEIHALGANTILKTAGRTPIQACEYKFPVDCFETAVALASTFTDIVVGTLQEAQLDFGTDGDTAFIPIVGGVIGQEGEQNGVYRAIGGKVPSALPFLTRSAPAFAYSALNQMFIVPGSCPNQNVIDIPIFDALSVPQNPEPKTQTLTFSFTNSKNVATSGLSLVYLNQQNVPIVEKISNVKTVGKTVSFTANFPYEKNLMNGLTLAAVTTKAGPFSSPDDVSAATIAGPGIIEIN